MLIEKPLPIRLFQVATDVVIPRKKREFGIKNEIKAS